MRRMFWAAVIGSLLISWAISPAHVNADKPTLSTYAEAAALIDVTSGRILYSKEGDKPMKIASLTKVMTAIVAIEQGTLSEPVTVSRNAFGKEGSSLYLKNGEEMSLHHLLYGLMLRSGNDAAVAIAEHIGGSIEGFALLMNQKAEELGMEHTQFINPHGLDTEGHYSSANDMAKLTAYALKNPTFQEIVKTKTKRVPRPQEKWDAVWNNKNRMLTLYSGADGVKTGYTKQARRTLISSATRDGQQLAAVTLNDPNDWLDHSNMLDYGFKHYPLHVLLKQGDKVGEGLVLGTSFVYPLTEDEAARLTIEREMISENTVAYRLGERGKLKLSMDGQMVGSVPIYAENSPRTAWNSRSAFQFTEMDQIDSEGSGFFHTFRKLWNALFTLSG
ncbi:D-alanyl-D-alanine carboxypeptidase family protein [Paenibacillus sp. J2TS4]|uniref:D-alanyl-D-alanine carboxypeptidase family protein n=1 Tax=Paenibacillus sp. J2TS4 TaxID=2807194 RepID=UPI001B17FCA0|nr:D-alanyl-D-alanine carboxypeptidase family protein [Paenibacillus sp. J2TS4]GIP32346.1 D-alanyl-D-alanine carboxypeptidase DacB [Paenibacillus sp. J2TS4]